MLGGLPRCLRRPAVQERKYMLLSNVQESHGAKRAGNCWHGLNIAAYRRKHV